MSKRRLAAIVAIVAALASAVAAIDVAVTEFPLGLLIAALIALALVSAWYGVLRRGFLRVLGLSVGVAALAAVIVLLLSHDQILDFLLVGIGAVVAIACARAAFYVRVPLPEVDPPERAVLFFNPKSGGGKAERFSIDAEARERGIEPVELGPDDDLADLVRAAIERGADGLAMAGGDGSQAIVAALAAEHDLPYACIPAGTRNHFALDLGVDRDDVVGALDAFVRGGERRVDLGEVNGRVFVNNVSLGLYAEAVQRSGYRGAKVKTLLDTASDVLGPEGEALDLRWRGPGGHEHRGGAAILVSNNRYRLGRAIGSGTRPNIDDGLLGIVVVGEPRGRGEDGGGAQRPWRDWTAPTFTVDADGAVATGIDGEAVTLEAPLRFGIRPGVLRVRVAPQHPGVSPSSRLPEGEWSSLEQLARIAFGPAPKGR